MKLFKIIILFALSLCGFAYDGPKTAGIENFTPGTYKIRGYVNCPMNKRCFLFPYHQTTRQYQINLIGEMVKNTIIKKGYYEVQGYVLQESIGDRMNFLVNDFMIPISSESALRNTVTKAN